MQKALEEGITKAQRAIIILISTPSLPWTCQQRKFFRDSRWLRGNQKPTGLLIQTNTTFQLIYLVHF